ncbi:protein Jumonji-like isoform X2 [Carassius auratus]|uniref:Protein Jumonji-like isoform X2 n=1 Tax=Carassius auratus TaxID=7957 RepID=A0A6P6LEK7_CARAU|nr:protein Jumonji-like isoform X2 [Carassius auratus]
MSRERPKRNIIQKKFDDNDGIPWSEERVVRRVLYLSLKEFKTSQKSKVENGTGIVNGSFVNGHLNGSGAKAGLFAGSCKSDRTHAVQSKDCSHEYSTEGPVRKRPRLQAQRKFAQSHPCSPSATPLKMLEAVPPSPAMLNHLTRRKPKTEDFLTFLCLRGSAALPSNMTYFGSAKDDEDLDEEEDEEEEEDSASNATSSCQSTPRRSKGPNKCIANGHVFNGHKQTAEENESSLRARGRDGVHGKEKNTVASARTSTTHNLRPNRAVQEQKQQPSKVNGTSGASAVSSRKTRDLRTPPTKAVKYPKGHVTYTKARLLKEAKLSLSTRTHTHPQHSNSGKAQISHGKMQKQVLSPATPGRLCGTDTFPHRRNGLRPSKRRWDLAGVSLTGAEVEVKRLKVQVVPLERQSRKAAQETPVRPQVAGSQRPKRTSAGKLMFTKQMHCKAKNSPTTSTRDILKPANSPQISEIPKTSNSLKQGNPSNTTEPLIQAGPKERGRRNTEAMDVPVFYPSTREFHDPLIYMEFMRGQAEAYGLYRVVPPADWRPECKLKEEMRFVSYVQHVHKLGRRWGPNVQQLACIRRHLQTQGINMEEPPLIGGCELDLARFFQILNEMGGMQQVTDLKSWGRLADLLGIPRSAQDRLAKLQEAYCQYLLSYDSLSPAQRAQLEKEVLAEKEALEKRSGPLEGQGDISQHAALLLPRSEPKNGLVNGALHRSGAREHLRELDPTAKTTRQRRLGKRGEEEGVINDHHKCIYRGKSFSLTTFFRAARNTMNMCFSKEPDTAEVEREYWRLVEEKECHVAVHCGRVDTKTHGSGFPVGKSEPFSKHGWNLTVLSNNSGSILRHLGAVPGVTIPWLNIGMVFSTSCWCRDQNSLPYIDYLHTGADCIWYCIPAEEKSKLDKVVHTLLQANGTPGLEMLERNIMISPEVLHRKGVKVYRTVQQSGQFMDLKQRRIEEPFSTEKLLYQITTCERDNKQLMNAVSSLIKDLRDAEIRQRRDLFEAGLRLSARYGTHCESQADTKKQQRSRFTEDTADRRCQVCQHLCYLSMVVHESDNVVFCLECAFRYIQKCRSPRGLKMMFRYTEEQINSLVNQVCGRALENGGVKQKAVGPSKTPAKRSPRNKSNALVPLSSGRS